MLSRRFVLSFLLVVAGAAATYAQAPAAAIAATRAEYQRIQRSRATYKACPVDMVEESADGGAGTAYYEGQKLKLLVLVYYWETGKSETQFFYKNGQLFFALHSLYRYNRPYYYDQKTARENGDAEAFDPKKSEITESRYYFQNGKLIQWLNHAGKVQPLAAAQHNEGYQELLTHEAGVRAQLKKQK